MSKISRLNNNNLSGSVPMSLTAITSLEVLGLSSNCLLELVPDNGSFSRFTPIGFANNIYLSGPVTGLPCLRPLPLAPPPPFVPPASIFSVVSIQPGENIRTAAIAGGVATGSALLFAALAVGFAYWWPRKPQGCFFDAAGQLKRFSLRELQFVTNNFSKKNIVGRGGYGEVYKGCLADGTLVAVKRLKEEQTVSGESQVQTEVEVISMAVHRNLVPLRGFCMTSNERLLVYPYMANGSVASCLRGIVGTSSSFKLHLVLHWDVPERQINCTLPRNTNHSC
ncbi:hypothetical protein Pint_26902 [Pistacia integerrima]|uniref:Uncharacterized protein n=1 Tax=Pistacia integerrima TaxID=434235 RepID=A0ACC0YS50_9ROSI|nr:hypothetical protein Pint_26902 [Pistacia integerrima]